MNPSLDTLCHIPSVNQAVNDVLVNYDVQTHNEYFQGKISATKRSGRYNSVDTVNAPPTSVGEMKGTRAQEVRSINFATSCPCHNG